MAEILLQEDAKAAGNATIPEGRPTLEDLAHEFVDWVTESGSAALVDAKANIPLNEPKLRG